MGIQIQPGTTITVPLISIEPAPPQAVKNKLKKKFLRRQARDYSQQVRWSFQIVFLLMNVWLGGEFYLWVRQFEIGNSALAVARPAGVEGWLPIAGLMNLKYWLATGQIPAIHPAAMFLLLSFLSIAFLFRKAFCSWLCPVGTLSEYLWRARPQNFPAQLPRARLAGYSAARAQISAAGILSLGGRRHVGGSDREFHATRPTG